MMVNGPIPILMYHTISRSSNPKLRATAVSPDIFEDQMRLLSELGYSSLTTTQYANYIHNNCEEIPDRPVVLTFDDAYADFRDAALPILENYGFNATVYVVTDHVGKTAKWLTRIGEGERKLLGWDDLVALESKGIEIGAHGCTHRAIDALPHDEALFEIRSSKSTLEGRLNRSVQSFAFPYGYYSKRDQVLLRNSGFTSACAVKFALSALGDDVFALARVMPTSKMQRADFRRMLSGEGHKIAPRQQSPWTYLHWQVRRALRGRSPWGMERGKG